MHKQTNQWLTTFDDQWNGYHNLGGRDPSGIQQAEDKDLAKHLTSHKTAPAIKNYPAQNINSCEKI